MVAFLSVLSDQGSPLLCPRSGGVLVFHDSVHREGNRLFKTGQKLLEAWALCFFASPRLLE